MCNETNQYCPGNYAKFGVGEPAALPRGASQYLFLAIRLLSKAVAMPAVELSQRGIKKPRADAVTALQSCARPLWAFLLSERDRGTGYH